MFAHRGAKGRGEPPKDCHTDPSKTTKNLGWRKVHGFHSEQNVACNAQSRELCPCTEALLLAGAMAKIAVACDDGCLRLFHAEEGEPGLFYQASMPHLEGRLLSVAWHPAGRIAVVGTSQGTLHAWDVTSKREILRVHTGPPPA